MYEGRRRLAAAFSIKSRCGGIIAGVMVTEDGGAIAIVGVTIFGPLAGEPAEPMTKEQLDAARKRIRNSWDGSVSFEKRNAERLIAAIAWLKPASSA